MISSSQSPLLSVTPVWCMDTANFINVEFWVCYGFLKHNIFSARESFVVVWINEEIRLKNRQRVSWTQLSKTLPLSLRTKWQCKWRGGCSKSLILLLFTRFSWDCTEIFMFGSSEVYQSQMDILGHSARCLARTFSDAAPSKGLRKIKKIMKKKAEQQENGTWN